MGPTHVQGGGKGRSEFYSKVSSLAPAIPERRPRDAQKSWHLFTSLITVVISSKEKSHVGVQNGYYRLLGPKLGTP